MMALVHSHYSLQAGVVSPQAWVQAAAARGYRSLALADVDGLYGAVEFAQAARRQGLQAIIGAMLEWTPGRWYTALVKTAAGYRQLCRLLTARHTWPRFTLAQAASQAGIDELIFLSRSSEVLAGLSALVAPESLYALPCLADAVGSRQPFLWSALASSHPPVWIPDAWLLEASDRAVFDCLGALRHRRGRSGGLDLSPPGSLLPEASAWSRRHPDRRAAEAIMASCVFEFSFGQPLLPRLALPGRRTAPQHLELLSRQGLERRYPRGHARRARAEQRLGKELEVVIAKGIADYFLYVHDIVAFARGEDIPVGVRGSAAACILSYLLGFTECCPIEHDLYFERFLNPGRRDYPDIDLDIADVRRDEVVDFCYRRWGADHVAMVATVQCYRERGARRDAARLLGLSRERLERLEAGLEACPDLERLTAMLTGRPRHLGCHCGGLLITPGPITDVTPLARAAKGILISHYEKDQAEAIGLIKMDLLGNSGLTVIDEACRHLRDRGLELREPGPRYDYKVHRLFARGDTLGVYQCESPGMRQLCRALAPSTPRETAAAISLIRPGPAAAGMKEAFIRRRRGLEPVAYLHPAMAEFLEGTYGVMLYQEDVMKVAVHLAGYSPADADVLRRAVSAERSSDAFAQERDRFLFQRSPHAGLPAAQAEAIWGAVTRFASYAYCKAHATVYARLAWLTARLKAHYPREFYAAVLNGHKSMYPPRVFVWDALRHGIPVLPPDIHRSAAAWTPRPDGLRAGLGLIRGLSRHGCEALLAARAQGGPFADLPDLLARGSCRPSELEALILVGACAAWGPREDLLQHLYHSGGQARQPVLLRSAAALRLAPLAVAQLALTGIPFGIHPTDLLPVDGLCRAVDLPRHLEQTVAMVGILDAVKVSDAQGPAADTTRPMSFVTLEDATGVYDAVLFPLTHERLGGLFTHAGPYRVQGRVIEQWGTCSLELQEAEAL